MRSVASAPRQSDQRARLWRLPGNAEQPVDASLFRASEVEIATARGTGDGSGTAPWAPIAKALSTVSLEPVRIAKPIPGLVIPGQGGANGRDNAAERA